MKIWNLLLILMQTGCQCSHLAQTKEADTAHSQMSTEVEQMEECQKRRMEDMENEERWLNCVMLNGSS